MGPDAHQARAARDAPALPAPWQARDRGYAGRSLDRWEIEVTGGGRIFYLLDREKHTVRVEVAGTGHPKITDK